MRHCDENRTAEANRSMEQEPRSEIYSNEGRTSTDDTYVVGNIMRHIGSGPHLHDVVRSYEYSKADDTVKQPPPTTFPNTLLGPTGNGSISRERGSHDWCFLNKRHQIYQASRTHSYNLQHLKSQHVETYSDRAVHSDTKQLSPPTALELLCPPTALELLYPPRVLGLLGPPTSLNYATRTTDINEQH